MSKLTESEKAHEAERITSWIALLQWIESARTELDQVHESRAHDPELDARMQVHDLREGFSWNEDASAGLSALLEDIASQVMAIGYPSPASKPRTG